MFAFSYKIILMNNSICYHTEYAPDEKSAYRGALENFTQYDIRKIVYLGYREVQL